MVAAPTDKNLRFRRRERRPVHTFMLQASLHGFEDFFGFAPDYTSNAASINGDDAIELFENGVVVDVFGDINRRWSVEQPGTMWMDGPIE